MTNTEKFKALIKVNKLKSELYKRNFSLIIEKYSSANQTDSVVPDIVGIVGSIKSLSSKLQPETNQE